jgi:hypothetical protein
LLRRFQTALKKYGVPEEEIFQTADLYERRNIPQVTLCLYALSRLVCHKHKCAHATSALAGDYFFTRETIRPMRSGWSYGGIAQFCSSFYSIFFSLTVMSSHHADAEASRIHGPSHGTQDGRQE